MGTFSQLCHYRQTADIQLGRTLSPPAVCEAPRVEHELERVPPSGCIVLGGSVERPAPLDGPIETVRARRLCEAVWGFRHATHYAEPSRDAQNSWGIRLAELLAQSDLAVAREVIDTIAKEGPPAGIFGALLLARIDRLEGQRRLRELARSTFPVRVITSPMEKPRELAAADVARHWLVKLGFDSDVP